MTWDRSGAAKAVADTLDPSGKRTLYVQTDAVIEGQVVRAFEQVVQKFGRVDVLVNNAGISRHKPIEEMTLELFEEVMRINVTGLFLCCKGVVPIMKKQGRGKIVNISSWGARTGRPGVGANYAAPKAAVISITQTLAREVGPAGIYVNAIAPGPILTEQTRQYPPEVFAKWNAGRAPYAALPIGTAISLQNGWPLIYPRKEAKEYGTRAEVEGVFHPGEKVVVVDDLTTTGGSKFGAIDKLKSAGLQVQDVVVLIDRQSGAAGALQQSGYRLHSVFSLTQLLDLWEMMGDVPADQIAAPRSFIAQTARG